MRENMRKSVSDPLGEPQYLNLDKYWRGLPRSFRMAFVSAFLLGVIVHLYVFSNLLLNHDGIVTIHSGNADLSLGRWSQKFFRFLSWTYEMPVVIALLTVLALALCAGLTVYILDIHSPACILLVSGFMVSFPSVAAIFSYLFVADAFFIAAFLQVAAVWVTKQFRYGWIVAIACIAVSLGSYQAFIGCSVALFLFDCILALFSDAPTKDVLKRGLRYIAIILAGLLLYRVLLAFFLWKNHAVLSGYKGISTAINSSLVDYLRTLPQTYLQLIKFFWSPSYLIWQMRLLQRLMFFLAAGCFFFLTIQKRIYKNPVRLLLLICGVALLPAALNLICVICAGQTGVNILMQYSYVFAYVFALKLFEMTATEVRPLRFGRCRHAIVLVSLALCAALVWADVCLSNTAYLALQLEMETSQAIGIRVLSRLEELEGYVPGETPVMLVDTTHTIKKVATGFPQLEHMTGISNFVLLGSYAGANFLKFFCGAESFRSASMEQREAITNAGVLASMPAFPAIDSIQFYDEVVIVKLS